MKLDEIEEIKKSLATIVLVRDSMYMAPTVAGSQRPGPFFPLVRDSKNLASDLWSEANGPVPKNEPGFLLIPS